MYGDVTISKQNKTRKQVTSTETIELQRKGTSDYLRVPASWKNSLRKLQGHLTFDATVEEDENGILYIVFKKVAENCQQT